MTRIKTKSGKQNVDESTGEVFDDVGEPEGSLIISDKGGALEAASMDDLFDAGFESVKTLKVGDPEMGNIPAYFGEVIGPGKPVLSSIPGSNGGPTIQSEIPTWQVRPASATKLADGSIKIMSTDKAVHNLVTPHQLNADLGNLFEIAKQQGGKGMFAVRWNRKKSIKGGARVVNDFDFMQQIVVEADVSA